jgi:hypothetical protein
LTAEIHVAVLHSEDLTVFARQAARQCTADHAAMAGDKYSLSRERKRHCLGL